MILISENGKRLEVSTSIEIIDVLELIEVQSLITLQLKLTVEWIDHRLTFHDLNENQNLNTLTRTEISQLWTPILVFTNTKMRTEANFGKKSTFATVRIHEGTVGLKSLKSLKMVKVRQLCGIQSFLFSFSKENSEFREIAVTIRLL